MKRWMQWILLVPTVTATGACGVEVDGPPQEGSAASTQQQSILVERQAVSPTAATWVHIPGGAARLECVHQIPKGA